MPCLNEELTLRTCIEKAINWLEKNNIRGEVVIGDNGSTDHSITIAESLGARVVNVPVRGYGAACYYATDQARGKYIIMGDSDDSYDFSNLSLFVEKLREGYDLVMGNRFQGGIERGAMPWKNRYFGNPLLSFICKFIFDVPAGDILCGLRGFSAEAFKKFNLHTMGMEYGPEMLIKARMLNMKIGEVPTTLSKDGRDRPPHLLPWRDGWRNLRFMLLFSPRWLFWYPGWVSMLTGISLIFWLYPGSRSIGDVTFDIHTMLYSSLMVIGGYQAVLVGVITRKLGFSLELLPSNYYLEQFNKYFKLEYALLFGFLLFVIGIVGLLGSIIVWANKDFGDLNPFETMRAIIPYSLAFIIGIQSILFAFNVGFIDLSVRDLSVRKIE